MSVGVRDKVTREGNALLLAVRLCQCPVVEMVICCFGELDVGKNVLWVLLEWSCFEKLSTLLHHQR